MYTIEICGSIEAICEYNKPQVLEMLKVILPALTVRERYLGLVHMMKNPIASQ